VCGINSTYISSYRPQIFEYTEQTFSVLFSEPCPSVQKVEWIDDTSYAVVFKVFLLSYDNDELCMLKNYVRSGPNFILSSLSTPIMTRSARGRSFKGNCISGMLLVEI
jgi:hypothetical protein